MKACSILVVGFSTISVTTLISSCYASQPTLTPLLLLQQGVIRQIFTEQLQRRDFIQHFTTVITMTELLSSSSSTRTESSLFPSAMLPTSNDNNMMIISDVTSTSSFFLVTKNLPDSYSVDQKFGTIETLRPVVQLEQATRTIQKRLISLSQQEKEVGMKDALYELYDNIINNKFDVTRTSVANGKIMLMIPNDEIIFKRIFDEYSTPISYKQRYLDNNAFLVYYTKGYDGPNRPTIETYDDIMTKQTIQYGLRNEIWIQWDAFASELKYQISSSDPINVPELINLIQQTIVLMNQYLDQAPAADIQTCMKLISVEQ